MKQYPQKGYLDNGFTKILIASGVFWQINCGVLLLSGGEILQVFKTGVSVSEPAACHTALTKLQETEKS